MTDRPERFTIIPDDYHVPYAGTTGDGRKFFLSPELFEIDNGRAYSGLFLWDADGTFSDIQITEVARDRDLPPGQAGTSVNGHDVLQSMLDGISPYRLEPITVEPFLRTIDGVDFGWRFGTYDDGTGFLNIEPGDFICYYEPWDGDGYDT